MPELDERIAHYIDTVAEPVTAEEARSRAPRVKPRRRMRRVAIGAVLAAACVAAGVVFASTRATTSPSPRVNVGNTPTIAPAIPPRSAHPEPHEGAPVYFAPTYVPPGYALIRAQGGDAPGKGDTAGSSEWTETQTWVQFNPAHDQALATLQIDRGPRVIADPMHRTDRIDLIQNDGQDPASVAVNVRLTTGRYVARSGFLSWEEPRGQRVGISCNACSLETFKRIAGELRVESNGVVRWPAPHDRFELESTAPGMASSGTNARLVAYGNGRGGGFLVVVADDTQEPPLAQLFAPDTKIVNLRGTQGIVGSRVNGPSYGVRPDMVFNATPQLTTEWLEYPNVEVAIGGFGLTEQQLLQIAAGVHEVTTVEWARLGGTPSVVGTETAPDATTIAAITHAFDAWLDGAHPDAQWPFIEDADRLRPAILAARAANGAADEYSGSIESITLLDAKSATVKFSILRAGATIETNTGLAIDDGGTWKVARETVCATISVATVLKD
jgi:hypothetical protein